MLVYVLLLSYFIVGALGVAPRSPRLIRMARPFLAIGALMIALLVGLRYEVGPDWIAYEHIFLTATGAIESAITSSDPGFMLVNWSVRQIGADIWLVNLFCGFVLAIGLLSLARTVPNPWLLMVAAVPYLVIVVGMSGARQATAIGFVMLGLSKFSSKSLVPSLFWILIGSLFHASAILVAVIVGVSYTRNRLQAALLLLISAVPIYWLVGDAFQEYATRYTTYDVDSQGVIFRVGMNVVAALFLLIAGKSMDFDADQRKLWTNMAIFSIALLPMIYFVQSTTIIDRVSLYGIPLQLVVFGNLSFALAKRGVSSLMTTNSVIIYSVAVFSTYMLLGSHAVHYLPYKSFLGWP